VAQSNVMSPYQRGFLAGVQAGLNTHGQGEWAGTTPIATPTRRRRRTSGARGLPHAVTTAAQLAGAATTKRRRTRKRRIAPAVNQPT